MRALKHLFVAALLLVVALFGSVFTADMYRRVMYPQVPRHEADVFFDIGAVFLVSLVVTWAGLFSAWWILQKRRTRRERRDAARQRHDRG